MSVTDTSGAASRFGAIIPSCLSAPHNTLGFLPSQEFSFRMPVGIETRIISLLGTHLALLALRETRADVRRGGDGDP